ncbi:MAG: uracil-DNA glycosylase family protein [Isosphaeraceae bacterium]
MVTLESLVAAIREEAARAPFPIDEPVYQAAKKDPLDPVLCAGSLQAPVCVFGRDLGKDEVIHGQPQIGAAGRLVRQGLIRAFEGREPAPKDRTLADALKYALLTNTVPYKPPGNKAYAESVKSRFRPLLARLLAGPWEGDRVITLGTEAFDWFAPYAPPGEAAALWKREDRYEADLPCELVAEVDGREVRKAITVQPLPHPSPLNQRWYGQFPALLAARLASLPGRGT